MRVMPPVPALAAIVLGLAASASGCGATSGATVLATGSPPTPSLPGTPRSGPDQAAEFGLLQRADLPFNVPGRARPPTSISLADTDRSNIDKLQTLAGAVFRPASCSSWLTRAFRDPKRVRGFSRVYPNQPIPDKKLDFGGGLVGSTVFTAAADLDRARRQVDRCGRGTVRLTEFGQVRGTFTMRQVEPPDVDAEDVMALEQRVRFPPGLPPETAAAAAVFNIDMVVMVDGGWTIAVSTAGQSGSTAYELAGRALARANTAQANTAQGRFGGN